jgi:hypothetical protein
MKGFLPTLKPQRSDLHPLFNNLVFSQYVHPVEILPFNSSRAEL